MLRDWQDGLKETWGQGLNAKPVNWVVVEAESMDTLGKDQFLLERPL